MGTLKLAILGLILATTAKASLKFTYDKSFVVNGTAVSLWFRTAGDKSATAEAVLEQDLPVAIQSTVLRGRLPKRLGILVDGTWYKTSGLWSASLRAPDGSSAVLFTPDALLDASQSESLIVHELTHLVNYRLRPNEKDWVREGIALLSEYIVTGALNPSIADFYAGTDASLNAPLNAYAPEYSSASAHANQYGMLTLYFYYLYRLCGRDALFNQLLASPSKLTGRAFVDEVLRTMTANQQVRVDPVCSSFQTSFRAFIRAIFRPDVLSRSGYVILSSLKPAVFTKPKKLGPFSAEAYGREPRQSCAQKDVPLDMYSCLKMRLN